MDNMLSMAGGLSWFFSTFSLDKIRSESLSVGKVSYAPPPHVICECVLHMCSVCLGMLYVCMCVYVQTQTISAGHPHIYRRRLGQ